MFFIVDCVQRRFNSRNLVEISGLLQATPNLGITIVVMCVLYSGLPNTLKFTCEFYIFSGLLEISLFFTAFLIFTANVIGLVGFSKCLFNGFGFGETATTQQCFPSLQDVLEKVDDWFTANKDLGLSNEICKYNNALLR